MYKKILGLLLIMAIFLMLGCTGKDQGSGIAQPTASPLPFSHDFPYTNRHGRIEYDGK